MNKETEVKKKYWNNGKLKEESHCKGGKQEGIYRSWYESGEKQGEYFFKNRRRVSEIIFHKSGIKKSEKRLNNGTKNGLRTGNEGEKKL